MLQVPEFLCPCLFLLFLHIANCRSGKCTLVIHQVKSKGFENLWSAVLSHWCKWKLAGIASCLWKLKDHDISGLKCEIISLDSWGKEEVEKDDIDYKLLIFHSKGDLQLKWKCQHMPLPPISGSMYNPHRFFNKFVQVTVKWILWWTIPTICLGIFPNFLWAAKEECCMLIVTGDLQNSCKLHLSHLHISCNIWVVISIATFSLPPSF
jgi:hypothetical protein